MTHREPPPPPPPGGGVGVDPPVLAQVPQVALLHLYPVPQLLY